MGDEIARNTLKPNRIYSAGLDAENVWYVLNTDFRRKPSMFCSSAVSFANLHWEDGAPALIHWFCVNAQGWTDKVHL